MTDTAQYPATPEGPETMKTHNIHGGQVEATQPTKARHGHRITGALAKNFKDFMEPGEAQSDTETTQQQSAKPEILKKLQLAPDSRLKKIFIRTYQGLRAFLRHILHPLHSVYNAVPRHATGQGLRDYVILLMAVPTLLFGIGLMLKGVAEINTLSQHPQPVIQYLTPSSTPQFAPESAQSHQWKIQDRLRNTILDFIDKHPNIQINDIKFHTIQSGENVYQIAVQNNAISNPDYTIVILIKNSNGQQKVFAGTLTDALTNLNMVFRTVHPGDSVSIIKVAPDASTDEVEELLEQLKQSAETSKNP